MKNHIFTFENFIIESELNESGFHAALAKAKDEGLEEFEFGGKTFKVKEGKLKENEDLNEGDEVAPDKILSPADKKRLKTAFENVVTGVDKLTFKKNGTIEGKRGYFYRHGQSPEKVAEQLKTALLSQGIEIEIVDAYDDFKPWPKDSNFVVVFRITK